MYKELPTFKLFVLDDEISFEMPKTAGYRDWGVMGNSLDNKIVGNDTNNRIDGGLGADTMAGGRGDDIYIVDDENDVVEEAAGDGNDIIMSHLTSGFDMRKTPNVEGLQTGGIIATGNDLNNNILIAHKNGKAFGGKGHDVLNAGDGNNLLYGEDGNDTMNGGLGVDTMEGGIGDDSYYVDNANDAVIEQAGEGVDTINTYITYTLQDNFENLILRDPAVSTWKKDINGTGNSLDNKITGNSGKNTLVGESGHDTLSGGKGHDVLIGGEGKDAFLFTDFGAAHADRIVDFNVDEDRILLDSNVFKMIDCGCSAKPTALKEQFFAFGSAKDSDDFIILGEDGGLRYDADGSGAECAAQLIGMFRPGPYLKAISSFDIFVV
jgi:Ca2+-binding RTX toxin-like protein